MQEDLFLLRIRVPARARARLTEIRYTDSNLNRLRFVYTQRIAFMAFYERLIYELIDKQNQLIHVFKVR